LLRPFTAAWLTSQYGADIYAIAATQAGLNPSQILGYIKGMSW